MYEQNGTCQESCKSGKYQVVKEQDTTRYQCQDECTSFYEANGT